MRVNSELSNSGVGGGASDSEDGSTTTTGKVPIIIIQLEMLSFYPSDMYKKILKRLEMNAASTDELKQKICELEKRVSDDQGRKKEKN